MRAQELLCLTFRYLAGLLRTGGVPARERCGPEPARERCGPDGGAGRARTGRVTRYMTVSPFHLPEPGQNALDARQYGQPDG